MQKSVIYLLVAVMLFSVVGFTAIILLDDGSSTENGASSEALAEAERFQQELQAQAEAEAAACSPLAPAADASPIESPEVVTFDEDITELETVDLETGDGDEVQPGDCIVAHYHGSLASDGTVFDSSYERGDPARFPLSGVIAGWQQGVPGMREGGIRRLVIPSELGYGSAGNPPVIAPDADLVFVVEVVRIEN